MAGGTTFGGGAIAGIVVGIAVLGALIALSVLGVLWYLRRRRSRRDAEAAAGSPDDNAEGEGDEYQPLGGRHELGGLDKAELDKQRAFEMHGDHLRELHGEAMPREAGGQAVHELEADVGAAGLEASTKR